MKNFADILIEACRDRGTPCVVGLDPRIELIPDFISKKAESLPTSSRPKYLIEAFHTLVINALSDLVPAVKLQSAFYELHGSSGIAAMEHSAQTAKENGLLVILDAKRGDIGSTAAAYAGAYLGAKNEDSLAGIIDALTVSPFLGWDTLLPFIELCVDNSKGIFVLIKTSNPGSGFIQNLRISGQDTHVFEHVAAELNIISQEHLGTYGYGPFGAVIGATYPEEADALREALPSSIFLVPGYGAQGGGAEDAARCFDNNGIGAIVSASRSITYTENVLTAQTEESMVNAIRDNVFSMIEDINLALEN